ESTRLLKKHEKKASVQKTPVQKAQAAKKHVKKASVQKAPVQKAQAAKKHHKTAKKPVAAPAA
ncbi:acid-shock protein, partial [Yersinia pestis]